LPVESRADLLRRRDRVQDRRVRVTTACATSSTSGLQSEAHRHLATALAELGEGRSAEAVELMIELSVAGFYGGDFGAMRDWAERAVAAATPLGEHALLAAALSVRAWAGAVAGERTTRSTVTASSSSTAVTGGGAAAGHGRPSHAPTSGLTALAAPATAPEICRGLVGRAAPLVVRCQCRLGPGQAEI
jgi:hypothetical protein